MLMIFYFVYRILITFAKKEIFAIKNRDIYPLRILFVALCLPIAFYFYKWKNIFLLLNVSIILTFIINNKAKKKQSLKNICIKAFKVFL